MTISSIVMLAVSIILFITFKIPKVLGDITGITAKKAVNVIREQNKQSGDKVYKPSSVNAARGKITDKMTQSGNLINTSPMAGTNFPTAKMGIQDIAMGTEAILSGGSHPNNENSISGETEILDGNIFEVIYDITFIHTNEIIN